MTDEKRYTERELIDVVRDVIVGEVNKARGAVGYPPLSPGQRHELEARYPIPVRTRGVRVTLSDGSVCWRCGDGYRVQQGGRETSYHDTAALLPIRNPTAEDFRQIARVLDHEQEGET